MPAHVRAHTADHRPAADCRRGGCLPCAPAALGLLLLPAADDAGHTQALSSELVASQELPRTLAAAQAPSLGSADSGSPWWGLSRHKFNTVTQQLGGSHGWHRTPHPLVYGHGSAQRGSEACPGSHGSQQTGYGFQSRAAPWPQVFLNLPSVQHTWETCRPSVRPRGSRSTEQQGRQQRC